MVRIYFCLILLKKKKIFPEVLCWNIVLFVFPVHLIVYMSSDFGCFGARAEMQGTLNCLACKILLI